MNIGLIIHNAVLPRVPVGIPSALRGPLPRSHSLPALKLLRAVSPQAKTWTQVPSETEKKVPCKILREDLILLCSWRACQTPTWFFESSNISWVSREPSTQQNFCAAIKLFFLPRRAGVLYPSLAQRLLAPGMVRPFRLLERQMRAA